jgi:acetylornithine deacetylase/succinyl-diaminopimelate desuccinylase-like protein
MRLVPNQTPKDITEKIKKYIFDIAPETVKVEFTALHGGSPVLIPIEGDAIKAAQIALEKAFGVEPVFMREGGSIPVVNVFSKELNAPVVLMGFGLPADNIHSPNESFAVSNFYGGIKASVYFIEEYTKLLTP